MSDDTVQGEMPRYKCHKEVHALRIRSIRGNVLSFWEDWFAPLDVDPAMFARYVPVPGDYYVVYEDGYRSISPRKAFEDGYARID